MTPPRDIQILGVNESGLESGNALMCDGRDLPWLQEADSMRVWAPWNVTYRDVIILDGENRPLATFNLTVHNLAVAADYDSLRALLLRQSP